jgi:hypothetical protein
MYEQLPRLADQPELFSAETDEHDAVKALAEPGWTCSCHQANDASDDACRRCESPQATEAEIIARPVHRNRWA